MKGSVMVGMSGGVDSSVAAALLLREGYKVIGVTLKLWDNEDQPAYNRSCCSLEDVDDARNAAFNLDIPFYVLNFKDLFKESVVKGFVNSYMEGFTPNPCIACNHLIKFDAMLHKALSMEIDYIATGHYANIVKNPGTGRYLLKKGKDISKDQSYVLYMLTQEQLKRTLLPLGGYTKNEVRDIARDLGLRVSDKPDSQDICFVGGGKYSEFIRENTDEKIPEGKFLDTKGNELGTHKGIINYTVGQRKGLGETFGKPMYVVEKRKEDNTVVLGSKEEGYFKGLIASEMNYIPYDNPPSEINANVRLRYKAKDLNAVIIPKETGAAEILFDTPQPFVTPGQAVVMYDGDTVLGGGTVIKGLKTGE